MSNIKPPIDLELTEVIEENKERMLFSIWDMPLEEKVALLTDSKRDGIRLNRFIHFVLKKYLEKDENILNLLYTYIDDKNSLKKNKQRNKSKILKQYHSIIKEYDKMYFPTEDDIEIDIEPTIYNNSQEKPGEIE